MGYPPDRPLDVAGVHHEHPLPELPRVQEGTLTLAQSRLLSPVPASPDWLHGREPSLYSSGLSSREIAASTPFTKLPDSSVE